MSSRLLRWWSYFRRAYGTYIAFGVGLANFVVIQYRLLVEYVPPLKMLFPNILVFAVAVLATLVPIAVVWGWLDYRKLSMPVDLALTAKASPYSRDLARALSLISEALVLIANDRREEAVQRLQEASQILRKWTR